MRQPRTQVEIDAEIKALKSVKERLLPRHRINVFHEDNEKRLDAQIEVLTERKTATEVYDDYNGYVTDSAMDAVDWLNLEADSGTLAEDWEPLCNEAS